MIQDDNVDVGLVFFGVQLLNVEALVEELRAADALNDKPILVSWTAGEPSAPARLRAVGIPCFDDPGAAIKAAQRLVQHGMAGDGGEGREPLAVSVSLPETGTLSEWNARVVLERAGIEVVKGSLAATIDAAVAAREDIGGPVALKIESADIAHKSEAGGVALGLADEAAVRDAFSQVTASARAYAPAANIGGVGVYEMVSGAVELIVGISRDPAFGPVILVGMGGIMAEVMEDKALGVAPLSRADAEGMVRSLKGFPMLDGARGRPKCDVDAVVGAILALSDLAMARPEISELDINPLMVLPDGVRAADALITVK
jgi:acyl-CoA synthetase (NDP forming)